MFRYLLTALLALTLVTGCKSKPKEGEVADGLSGGQSQADIADRPLGFDPLGSDSGTISGLATIHFPYDSATLTAEAKATLAQNAEWIKNNAGVTLQIEGHCDSKGSNEYNLTLGERRAMSVKTYMQGLGVEPSRLATTSYGEEKLIALGDSEADHAKNRRANFVPTK